MVGRDIPATEIGKHSKLIKAAQEEMSTMDVLVCGRCLAVYHFVDDFEQHKQAPCSKENNNVRECNDTKQKIWAFLLWKATQLQNTKGNNNGSSTAPNSWTLYQTWVKMDESLRDTWIMAGRTIQSFSKFGQGTLQEMPVKITKTVVNNNGNVSAGDNAARKPLTQTKPQISNMKSMKLPAGGAPKSSAIDAEVEAVTPKAGVGASNTTSAINTTSAATSPANITAKLVKKSPASTTNLTSPIQGKVNTVSLQSTKGVQNRRALRSTSNGEDFVHENVEKIVAKRFNPRIKMHEYLVKWEGRPHDQNTWEPMSHLEHVVHFVDVFEAQLARQKENRAAMQAKQGGTPTMGAIKTVDVKKPGSAGDAAAKGNTTAAQAADKTPEISPSARPTRTSKMKAMDQVKQWVSNDVAALANTSAEVNASAASLNSSGGSGSGNTSGTTRSSTLKRKFNDSNEDLSNSNTNETTTTMEDLEEDLIPSHTVKRMKNGNGVSVESKVVRVNGTNARGNTTTFSGESIPVGPKSAEVILTKDKGVSGVVRKPGFVKAISQKIEAQVRILSKEERAVMSTGIVRNGGAANAKGTTVSNSTASNANSSDSQTPRQQQLRLGAGGRQTPTTGAGGNQTVGSIGVSGRQGVQRIASNTIIQRKPLTPGQRTVPMGGAGGQFASSGRMVIPRSGGVGTPTATRSLSAAGSGGTKTVTPEQKILQLSKSGDLKVTKKMMTREDAVAQRLTSQQQRQQQLQRQQQSQVQIQKVQQLAPPNTKRSVSSVCVRKRADGTYTAHEEQSQLCPITGKVLGQDSQPSVQLSSSALQAQMLTAAAAAEQQHQEQLALQQQQQEADQAILLTSDQMLTNEDGTPLLVTGEDGTVYQVAGKNAEGQTILVTQGPDGEQQFAYIAAADGDENPVLNLENSVAEAVGQLPTEQQAETLAAASAGGAGGNQYLVKTTQEDGTTHMVAMTEAELQQHQALIQQQVTIGEDGGNSGGSGGSSNVAVAGGLSSSSAVNQLCIQTNDGGDGQEANIPAEVVQAELPSPGGTRRVVLLLQDGTFMMTEMQDDEFKALNIAA